MGDYCTCNYDCILHTASNGSITMGNDIMIASGVMLRPNPHRYDRADIAMNRQGNLPGQITVGNDVWIGAHVFIGRNINIGEGSVIGANSVVTHDVAPYTIVAGVPAKVIKKRSRKDQDQKPLDASPNPPDGED
jgi:galactoside O-acetyltransferase